MPQSEDRTAVVKHSCAHLGMSATVRAVMVEARRVVRRARVAVVVRIVACLIYESSWQVEGQLLRTVTR